MPARKSALGLPGMRQLQLLALSPSLVPSVTPELPADTLPALAEVPPLASVPPVPTLAPEVPPAPPVLE